MKLNIISKWLIATSFYAATLSQAAIMEGSFNGFVTDVQERHPDDSNFRFWNGDITGQSISGTFWYDTTAPKNILAGESTNTAIYTAEQINWLGIIFNIDGKTFDVSNLNPQGLPPYYVEDKVIISDTDPIFTDEETLFTLYDSIERDMGFGGGESLQGKITLGNSISTILNGISLEQEFDWVNQGPTDFGESVFTYRTSVDGLYANTWVTMSLSDVQIKIQDKVSVPEPSSLGLLTLSLLVLGWRLRNSA
ncbi:MAG: PEP-CTERM sorting domain-containing protein [Pseudomonadota bacterium]